jgi:UDP-N-acetylmuramate dehydrogenase
MQERVPLAPFTTLGIGGAARWFVRASSINEVAAAHQVSVDRNMPLFVLGGGSNILVADEGIDGLVVHVDIAPGATVELQGGTTVVRAGAGEPWDDVVAAAVATGRSGLECLSGIPGSAGGTPIQNVGAYGQEVADAIVEVTALDRRSGQLTILSAAECAFGYRTSRFKAEDAGRFIVCEILFALRADAPNVTYPDLLQAMEEQGTPAPSVDEVRRAVLTIRRRKGMIIDALDSDTRSVGSFFMNPVISSDVYGRLLSLSAVKVPCFALPDGRVKVPAAWLIERAGFSKGYREGAVGLSGKHPLAIVNRGAATARDVLALATRIKRQVADRFGVELRPEPVFVGFRNDPDVAYLERTSA